MNSSLLHLKEVFNEKKEGRKCFIIDVLNTFYLWFYSIKSKPYAATECACLSI